MRLLSIFSAATAAQAAIARACSTLPFGNQQSLICEAPRVQRSAGGHKIPESDKIRWDEPTESDCLGDACIYIDPNFGGGIAIVSTLENAQVAAEFPAVKPPDRDSAPFYITEIEGKGRGAIANRTIKKGEVLMVHPANMLVQLGPPLGDEPKDKKVPLYDRAMAKMPTEARELFMSQYGEDVYMKLDKNCFQLYLHSKNDGAAHLGCYPKSAIFNHDCRPNVHYRINNITQTTVAVREIQKGEELTISYIDSIMSRAERIERLHDWGFNCSCPHCLMSDKDAALSDANIKQIKQLESDLDNFSDSYVTADTGEELVELYQRERLDIYFAAAYTRAAINFALFGEVEKSMEYATHAVEALIIENGPQARDLVPMRVLAEEPQKHWSWGKTRESLFD